MLFSQLHIMKMKRILLFVTFVLITMISYSHEYYFSFAEMEYNTSQKRFELTLIVSTHDIEHWLQNKGLKIKELEDYTSDTIIQKEFGTSLLNGFSVSMNNTNIVFQMTDYDVKANGLTEFYFISTTTEIISPLLVRYDLLMDQFPEQQNKLTFLYKTQKNSYAFLPTSKEQVIKLEN